MSAGLLATEDDVTTIAEKSRPRLLHRQGETELTRLSAMLFLRSDRFAQEASVAGIDEPGEEEKAKEEQTYDVVLLPLPTQPSEVAV